jgi:hypothetical protein
MAKAAAGFDLAAAEATEIPAGGKAPVDFIVGYLWILVGSSWATSRLELHCWSSNVRVPYRAPNARAL